MSKTVVVVAEVAAGLRVQERSIASDANADVSQLSATLRRLNLELRPLFGETESRLIARASELTQASPRPPEEALERFYALEVPNDQADAVAAELAAVQGIAGAYVQPDPFPPVGEAVIDRLGVSGSDEPPSQSAAINGWTPSPEPAPPSTPNFVPRQTYRDPAPGGIDVAMAWSRPGGRGAGVRIIDCEGAWRFTHEDLLQNQGGVIGPETTDVVWRNHGTAVVSVIGGDDNGFGVLGIAPEAIVRGSSIFGPGGLPAAIRLAADALQAGDIILLEVHYTHPLLGFTSVEWWPADYAAIRYAISRGVIVVEAAGNGNNNLDDPIYDTPLTGFPDDWRNAFRRGTRDSGAVLVGAGTPPPGTHGKNLGPDRSRVDFSNYGSAVDVQGWGLEVTSAGYGDLQGGANEDLWYSDQFNGTSSAAPIVVGALACVQGALRAAASPLLTPATARSVLRATGSPQTDAPGRPTTQRIGNRPDLRAILDQLLSPPVTAVALHRYWNAAATDHFYTTNWSELGAGGHGWVYEGIQCYVLPSPVSGTKPLYRYWNASVADHFYTTNWGELGSGGYGWTYEGIQGHVRPGPAPDVRPLYRYWGDTEHFYTTNWGELGSGGNGWTYEGVACYVYETAATVPGSSPDVPSMSGPESPPVEGGINAIDFVLKARAGNASELVAGRIVPFPEKALATRTDAPIGGSQRRREPSTDWTTVRTANLSEAREVRQITINVNLRDG